MRSGTLRGMMPIVLMAEVNASSAQKSVPEQKASSPSVASRRGGLFLAPRRAQSGGEPIPIRRPLGEFQLKTAALALAALALFTTVPGLANAETITRERFGCQARELTERLFQLVAADEAEAFGQLLKSSLAAGACRMWTPGEDVRVESRTAGYGCLALTKSSEACHWTPISAIEKPE